MGLKSRRDLCDRALEVLTVLAAGQTAEVEDLARVDGYIETTVDDLRARDVIYIPDYDEFDTQIFDDLAKVLANNSREAFGMANDPRLAATGAAAENSLLIKSAQGPTYATLKTTYI